ncbi:type VI secretion system baseplate subunit TssK [Acinetobacter chinensis]|uniref:Type VI secretion system baseplate subunit TssK n=1 Tax=Acinetobacter chinensis TaxID=2004650 RepID=A0ABU3WBH6_9GAMM|nr:type VI secretion system baseplate subunit TssK [Acinetobacter chinensis]MDV2467764.1 type VI secretion system baseplate subunit TssK [Acinetobacter chinensis]
MFKAEKILWAEGLFLRPQHFQLQDAYHEQHLSYTINATIPYAYGVKSIQFDETLLNTNVLALDKIEILWQDNEVYSAPSKDLLPEPLLLDNLNLRGEMLIYLTLPMVQPNKKNLHCNENIQPGRYHSYLSETHDLYTDASPADISLLQRRAEFRIKDIHAVQDEDMNGMLFMPIGKLLRHNSGTFEFDPQFIPPVLHIEASHYLISNLKRTLNIIQAKIKNIQNNNRENEQKIIEFRSGDIVSFWLINTLNTSFSILNHLYRHAQIHPERLYLEMLRLTGSLLTFSTAYSVDQLPEYNHLRLQESFGQLDHILRTLLDTIISSRYLSISLHESRPSYWSGSLESDRITTQSRLYLAVSSSSMQSHELIRIVPLRFKAGNSADVEQRVIAALPAVPLHHMVQVPTAIPVRSGVSYFELEAHHELYQRMLESESICIYIPSGFQDISIELIAVTNGH